MPLLGVHMLPLLTHKRVRVDELGGEISVGRREQEDESGDEVDAGGNSESYFTQSR